jgi:hypothetical protein
MSFYDDEVDYLLEALCDCEEYHECKWHLRLRAGEDRRNLEREMSDELFERHYEWAVKKGLVDPLD